MLIIHDISFWVNILQLCLHIVISHRVAVWKTQFQRNSLDSIATHFYHTSEVNLL